MDLPPKVEQLDPMRSQIRYGLWRIEARNDEHQLLGMFSTITSKISRPGP